MWVKIKRQGFPVQFIRLDDLRHIFIDCQPVPIMRSENGVTEWYEDADQTVGIFYKGGDETGLLVEFGTVKEAEESLCNLFKMWSAYRDSLYLFPQGTRWCIEPVGVIGREDRR